MAGIESAPPKQTLGWAIESFVIRNEVGIRWPVLLLPELRPSIQIFLKAPYWTKPLSPGGHWERVPAMAIWGPRYTASLGWSAPDICVLALVLTPEGCRALTGNPVAFYCETAAALPHNLMHALKQIAQLWPNAYAFSEACSDILHPFLDEQQRLQSPKSQKLSDRHKRRQHVGEFGIAPKKRARIARLDRYIRSLHRDPWESPGPTPPELGFFDQAHLIRECKALTTLTPNQIKKGMRMTDSSAIRSIAMPQVKPPQMQELGLR